MVVYYCILQNTTYNSTFLGKSQGEYIMVNYQYVKQHIKTIKAVQYKPIQFMMENTNKLEDAINSCNMLKKHLREEGNFSNVRIRKFLGSVLSTASISAVTPSGFLTNRAPCKIVTDMYSRTGKYYPSFLMGVCPAGNTTTLLNLITSEQYIFRDNVFKFNETFANIPDDRHSLVREYSDRIEHVNGYRKFIAKDEKLVVKDFGFTLHEFTLPTIDLTLYMGVELEVGRKSNTPKGITKVVMKDLNPEWEFNERSPQASAGVSFAILKHDGSLNQYAQGFEIVSAPATLKHHRTAWDTFFSNSARFLRSYTISGCGMHVHVSKAGFKNEIHQGKFISFYNLTGNREFIETIAGRKANEYCRFRNDKKVSSVVKKEIDGGDRRVAVNMQNTHTLEVRIFKGNVKKEGFFKNLEFVHATIEFTKQSSISMGGLSHTAFLEWLKQPTVAAEYPYLVRWLIARERVEVKTIKLQDYVNPKNTGKQHLRSEYIQDVA